MSSIVHDAVGSFKHHGPAYVIKNAPSHIVRRGKKHAFRSVFDRFTMDRNDLMSYCRARGVIWEYDSGAAVEIEQPIFEDVPEEFEHLLGHHEISPNFVCKLNDVRLLGQRAVPILGNGKIVSEPFPSILPNALADVIQEVGISRIFDALLFPNRAIQSGARETRDIFYLISRVGGGNETIYGHWVSETLPQLQAFEWVRDNISAEAKLLVDNTEQPWLQEIIEIYGYSTDDVITWTQQFDVVDTLIIPKMNHIHDQSVRSNPIGRRWARDRATYNADCSGREQLPERIFASRRNAERRRIRNFEQVFELLQKYNYEEVNPETLDMNDEICMFGNADFIIGTQGSNLQGFCFSSNCYLIALAEVYNPIPHVIAEDLDLDFVTIYNSARQNSTNIESDYIVDIDKLERALIDLHGEI